MSHARWYLSLNVHTSSSAAGSGGGGTRRGERSSNCRRPRSSAALGVSGYAGGPASRVSRDPSFGVVFADCGCGLVVDGGRDVSGVEAGEFFFFLRCQGRVFGGGQVVAGLRGGIGGGDHVDGVGDQARVLVGRDGAAVGVGVGEMFGGQVQ